MRTKRAPNFGSSHPSGGVSIGGGDSGGGGNGILTLEEIIAGATQTAQLDIGGVIPVSFDFTDLSASLDADILFTPLIVPFRGSFAAISFWGNDNKTAGTCTFTPYVDGVPSSPPVDWATGTWKGYKVISQSTSIFDAGAEVDVRVTTSGAFTPTTVDGKVTLFIVLNPTTTL